MAESLLLEAKCFAFLQEQFQRTGDFGHPPCAGTIGTIGILTRNFKSGSRRTSCRPGIAKQQTAPATPQDAQGGNVKAGSLGNVTALHREIWKWGELSSDRADVLARTCSRAEVRPCILPAPGRDVMRWASFQQVPRVQPLLA